MTREKRPNSKVLGFLVSFGIGVVGLIVSNVYRDQILFYWDPELSLSLDAGSRGHLEGSSENVRRLLERGVSPNYRIIERGNYAAIHEAAHWGIESSLRLFVDAGADPDQTVIRRGEELTPLDLACKFGGPAAVDVLASYGGKRLLSHVVDFEGNPNPAECFE